MFFASSIKYIRICDFCLFSVNQSKLNNNEQEIRRFYITLLFMFNKIPCKPNTLVNTKM